MTKQPNNQTTKLPNYQTKLFQSLTCLYSKTKLSLLNMNFQKKHLLVVFILLFTIKSIFATHYRAGEILYEYLGPLTYKVTIITYTETAGQSQQADQDTVFLNWGDGTIEPVGRSNGSINVNGVPDGEILTGTIKKNIYISNTHTYPGALPFYVISIVEQNRVDNVVNMTNSVDVPVYLEDTLKYIPPELFEGNSSPILLNPPIDYANILDTFYHNPNAYDPDGDSLYYSLVPSLQALDNEVPNYEFPDQFPPGPNNNITINALTGEIIWAVPQSSGDYNIAIRIREFRNGQCIGVLLRDMQILVGNNNNDPPQLTNLIDTCIYAGDTLDLNIEATDPNLTQTVTITVQGAPFQIDPSRVDFFAINGNPATANFQWRTICTDIRPQFYEIVFKAEDNFTIPLVDLETWLVHVVAPPPDSLFATVSGNDVLLNWDTLYRCYDSPDFQYFSVWRKYGCENIDRIGCETGLEGTGYELIADNILDYHYLDVDVDRGHIYSYRILAHFGTNPQSSSGAVFNKTVSVPSHEVCVELPLDLPVITNVSVEETSQTNGVIFVRWSKPKAGAGLVDTLQDVPPYTFELYRSEGFVGANFSLIKSFTANTFAGFNDTLFYDSLLNTFQNPYSYKVKFFANNGADEMGETSVASSIYLTIASSDQSLLLSWQEDVPWVNDTFTIFKLNESTLTFDSLDITEEHNYTDTGLTNDSTYCYRIRSKGKYFSTGLINPIINFSQDTCAIPLDTLPPCAPKLTIKNDCETVTQIWTDENYQNRLSWQIDNTCASDAVLYRLYFKSATQTDYSLLEETTDTFYIHQLNNSLAGCYYLTAVDGAQNESIDADTICVENCALYNLPNVFTPNSDGDNDFFIPFPGWRFVEKIEMKIYGRWGNLVFQTENPAILWNGTDVSGKDLKDGIYLYNGFYYIRKLDGSLEQKKLPPNKKGGGFVHLIRSE